MGDRWGPPSVAEEDNGMPYHGEASAVQWENLATPSDTQAILSATLPLAGLYVKREITLASNSALLRVKERVTNMNKLGRMYNMVQHPTISAPFLDADTLVDCNGKRGFAQGPNRTLVVSPEMPTFEFPSTFNRMGSAANARGMSGGEDDVQSYEVEPGSPLGWICATSSKQGLLLGYVWPSVDYPWISLWCCSRDGSPCARGLEFGTTGLHQPFPILAQHPKLLGLPTFAHIDAGESQIRSYAAFLLRVPSDFSGVQTLSLSNGQLILTEHDGKRQLTVAADMLKDWQGLGK